MVIDTSALIAILQQEPEASIYAEARKGPAGGRDLELLLHQTQMEIVAFTLEQMELAKGAWRRYGKGQHPARLNFGDCCTYALAKVSGEPLLSKGDDFPKTDLRLLAC